MEAKAKELTEVDTKQEEEKVVELGDASQETRGGFWGPRAEFSGYYL